MRSLDDTIERRDQSRTRGGSYGRPSSDGPPTDVRGYISLLKRRKWIILPFLVLMPLAAYIYSAGGAPSYEASAQVFLNRQSQTLSGLDDPLVLQPERVIRTQTDIGRLPEIAQRVVQAAGLKRDAATFLDQSSIDSNDQVDLLTFRVRDEEPESATVLANLYAQKYIEYRRELDTKALREASQTVRQQIRQLEAKGLSVGSALYATFAQRLQQLESAQTLQKSNALLVRQATHADQVAPQPKRTALLSFAIGIVLALGLAFLVDTLDTRVRSPEQLADALGLALLGSLPEPPRSIGSRRRVVMLEDPDSANAELFRMLRTSLEVTALAGGCRSIMVTSALASEGKSTTAANLGIAFARTGRHVVLVDLDLRRPSLDRFFDLGGRAGITDLAFERTSLGDAGVRLTFGDAFERPLVGDLRLIDRIGLEQGNGRQVPGVLDVIGSGTLPQSPGEFMVTSELAAALERLQEWADLILVDGPPLLLAGDALTLSSKVDAVLLVTRMNAFRRGQIGELERVLAASPAMKLGLVATGHNAMPRRAYYGYGSWAAHEARGFFRSHTDQVPGGQATVPSEKTEGARATAAEGRADEPGETPPASRSWA